MRACACVCGEFGATVHTFSFLRHLSMYPLHFSIQMLSILPYSHTFVVEFYVHLFLSFIILPVFLGPFTHSTLLQRCELSLGDQP